MSTFVMRPVISNLILKYKRVILLFPVTAGDKFAILALDRLYMLQLGQKEALKTTGTQ